MLKFLPGYRKLMRDGAQAQAVVIKSVAVPGSHGVWGCDLRLRVHFDDGTTTELDRSAQIYDLGGRVVVEGDVLPVRFDAADRSKIELDVAAARAAAHKQRDEAAAAAIARTEARLARRP